jgi:Ca-activated chloride channel family protein
MKRAVMGLMCGMATCAMGADDPRNILGSGDQAYRAKQFEAAQHAFATAATNAAVQGLDPAVARYNEAAAEYRLGRMDAATSRLAEALRTGDLQLQQKAWYNRGDALLARTTAQQQQGKLEEAQKTADEAATHFEQAILLDPTDADAKMNYELCLRLQQELKKQQQQQEQQKQDQSKKDKEQDKQDKQNEKQPDQQKPDAGQQQKQPQQNQPQPSQQPKPNQKQQQAAARGEKKNDEMTPAEAAMLLDAMRQEEQAQRDKIRLNIGHPEPVEKDW